MKKKNLRGPYLLRVVHKLSDVEKAYIAGFIDGEGCIHISSSREGTFCLCLTASQTTENVMYWIQERLEGNVGYIEPEQVGRKKNGELCRGKWTWSIYGESAMEVLKSLLPHLKVKEYEAETAIAFQKRYGFRRRHSLDDLAFFSKCRESLQEQHQWNYVS